MTIRTSDRYRLDTDKKISLEAEVGIRRDRYGRVESTWRPWYTEPGLRSRRRPAADRVETQTGEEALALIHGHRRRGHKADQNAGSLTEPINAASS